MWNLGRGENIKVKGLLRIWKGKRGWKTRKDNRGGENDQSICISEYVIMKPLYSLAKLI
jgi:hypothetical protein